MGRLARIFGFAVAAFTAGCFDGQSPEPSESRSAAASSLPAFVQVASATPQSPQSSVIVTFGSAQSAGNANVVVVGWNDTTAAVTSVTDTKGNAYARAVGPTAVSGTLSQSI